MRDVPVNHRFERAYPLGVGYDLNELKTSGVYDVTDPVNGPDAGGFFVEVFVNAGQSVTDTTVLYRLTDKATAAVWSRIYDETAGFGAWSTNSGAQSVDARASGAAPITLLAGVYRHNITTGGTAGNETVNLPTGDYVGQRILVHELVRTNASDVIQIGLTNLTAQAVVGDTAEDNTITAMSLDAAGDFLLAEWMGTDWNLLYTNGTVTLV
jgi:hypothetical protein